MEIDRESKFIITTVIFGDLVIINSLFALLPIFVGKILFSEWDLIHNCVVISLCYLVSVSIFGGVTLHRRMIRADQLLSHLFRNIFGFFLIWISLLAVSHVYVALSWALLLFGVLTVITITAFRLIYQAVLRGWRKRGTNGCHIVFVGSTRNMMDLYEEMTVDVTMGYHVIGYFDNQPNPDFEAKYLGTCDEVTNYIRQNSYIQRLYCSLPSSMTETILSIISCCEGHLVRFFSVPNLSNYLKRRVNLEMFSNTPVLSIRPEPLAKLDSRIIKRSFDILFSGLFLITAFPLIILICGTLIKCSSPGPIFFKQKRTGLDGREFWCYKFRSMRVNDAADTQQACEDDPRKTKIGDFMRRTNIDELPQFVNVFLGQMSVVGPRPHMLKHTEEYSQLISTYMVRHLVKPGVTGWAQISGFRGETRELAAMEGRIKADIWYMEHWTFMLDLYIIYKTVTNVLLRQDSNAF